MKIVRWAKDKAGGLDNCSLIFHILFAAALSIAATYAAALIDAQFEDSSRPDLESLHNLPLFLIAVIFSPILETLLLQLLPVWLLSRWNRSEPVKFIASTALFTLSHTGHGIGIAIGVGLVCGAIFAFSAILWAKRSLSASFWVVCCVHAIHNLYFFAGDRLLSWSP
jgi:ABC-type multidrug transport system permease subunit